MQVKRGYPDSSVKQEWSQLCTQDYKDQLVIVGLTGSQAMQRGLAHQPPVRTIFSFGRRVASKIHGTYALRMGFHGRGSRRRVGDHARQLFRRTDVDGFAVLPR